jgi:hypothetical protein
VQWWHSFCECGLLNVEIPHCGTDVGSGFLVWFVLYSLQKYDLFYFTHGSSPLRSRDDRLNLEGLCGGVVIYLAPDSEKLNTISQVSNLALNPRGIPCFLPS